ncbi:ImmA/IrrE family metallo-endopeptidase [Bradyrhizobium sp.]|uniref:ImmA/IrrE family metallo-endopeptidase n=1 Tax=Bradyrhizobium sp. TaxID=376 RepID=UPI0025BB753B|nr:ImmA/IrrE family metallo-endopeptidase [Bradyrhizobium sp.]
MALRRGFKAEANWWARSVREELGIAPHLPICPWKLAELLGFPVVALSEYEKIDPAVGYLASTNGRGEFSAITLFSGTARLIIHNDSHALKRQAANIAHELAHGVLFHPPKPPFDVQGTRHYDPVIEEEANWLGPALLVSEEAANHIARMELTPAKASDVYKVSEQLMLMRLNVTGALIRASRRRQNVSLSSE